MGRLPELSDRRSRVRFLPELGGAVADMTARMADGSERPVLRPYAEGAGVFGVGMNLLVPFSNRISGGGFTFDAGDGPRAYRLDANLEGEPYPIHGDGFQKPWRITGQADDSLTLTLEDGGFGPFNYHAEVVYRLVDGHLLASLRVVNTGPALPFGGGFHPWFPRSESTQLQFHATSVWLECERHLPTEEVPLDRCPDFDFRHLRRLPIGLINNAFIDWNGHARIAQKDLGMSVLIMARRSLGTAIVYSPGQEADFFCFEPVSHPVDAHNAPGKPGLVPLATGDAIVFDVQIAWTDDFGPPG